MKKKIEIASYYPKKTAKKFKKSDKIDDAILKIMMEDVKDQLHRRFGKKMCEELDANCFVCKVSLTVAYLNAMIDYLD